MTSYVRLKTSTDPPLGRPWGQEGIEYRGVDETGLHHRAGLENLGQSGIWGFGLRIVNVSVIGHRVRSR